MRLHVSRLPDSVQRCVGLVRRQYLGANNRECSMVAALFSLVLCAGVEEPDLDFWGRQELHLKRDGRVGVT